MKWLSALLLLLFLAGPAPAEPAQELETLDFERRESMQHFFFEGREAGEPSPMVELGLRYQQFEESYRGSEEGLSALFTLVTEFDVPSEIRGEAVERILSHYREHPALGQKLTCFQYGRKDGPAQRLLEEVRAHSERPENRAYAALTIGLHAAGAGDLEAARKFLAQAVDAYPDLKTDDGRTLKAVAEIKLFAAEHLREGAVAPEITGIDGRGEPLKLSDHRGKVVMLSFWGDW